MLLRHRETPEREKIDLPLSQSRKRREEEKSQGSETRPGVVRKEEVQGRKDSRACPELPSGLSTGNLTEAGVGVAAQPSSGYNQPPDAHSYCSP